MIEKNLLRTLFGPFAIQYPAYVLSRQVGDMVYFIGKTRASAVPDLADLGLTPEKPLNLSCGLFVFHPQMVVSSREFKLPVCLTTFDGVLRDPIWANGEITIGNRSHLMRILRGEEDI